MEHENRDPITGHCADCGATREQIDDNLFPTCFKAHGPYRAAIIALRKEAHLAQFSVDHARHAMRRHEEMVVYMQKQVREQEARKREINAALTILDDAPPLILQGRDR